MLGISKIQNQDRSNSSFFIKSTPKFKSNSYVSFGRSANFNELQKINVITNFFGLHPSIAADKVGRSIKGLPEATAEKNPALKALNQGLRNLFGRLADGEEVSAATVKSFNIPSDNVNKMDEVKDLFKGILFDSTEESRKQPENIYKTFMLKFTKNLTTEKKAPSVPNIDASLLEETGLPETKMIKALAPVKHHMPVNLDKTQRKKFIDKLFSLKGDELKNHFSQAVEVLPPVETETKPQLKDVNALMRNISNKLAEQETPYLPSVVSEFITIKGSMLPVDERLSNALLKIEKEQNYIPFFKKLTGGPCQTKKSTRAELEADGIIIGKPKKAAKPQAQVKMTKKQKAAIERQKIIEDAIINIEKKEIELVEISSNIKKFNSQLKGVNTELERLKGLKERRSMNSETFNIESQRQTYIERIKELEGRKNKLGSSEYSAKLDKLNEKHGDAEITDKRVLNKINRYETKANEGVETPDNSELTALKKEFAQFSEKHPSIADLNHKINFVDKLLNFDEYYAKTFAKLNKPTVLKPETKIEAQILNGLITKLKNENKSLLPKVESVKMIDKKPVIVKIDYDAKAIALEAEKPSPESYKTPEGYINAAKNWNKKFSQLKADKASAKKFEENQTAILAMTARIEELEKTKGISQESQLALEKLELQKTKVERYLAHVDEKTGKTGRQKLEAKSAALKAQLENKLSGAQNENGTYISGIRNVWDLSTEISSLKSKQNTLQTKLEAEQVKYDNIERQKGSLEKVILRKSKGQKKFVDEAKESIMTKEFGKETKDLKSIVRDILSESRSGIIKTKAAQAVEMPTEEIIRTGKKKPVAKSASARANANANETQLSTPVKAYKMTEAQEVELEKLKAGLKEFDNNEAEVRNKYNKCLYLLCGGSPENYGLTGLNRIIVDNKRINDLKKVEGEGQERAKKLIGNILRNAHDRHLAEPQRIGYYEQLEILEEKMKTTQGQDLVNLEKTYAQLKEEMAGVEATKNEISEQMSILSKERIMLQKEMNKIEYGIKD